MKQADGRIAHGALRFALIDDHTFARRAMRNMLVQMGIQQVDGYSSVRVFLGLLERKKICYPDVIVVDMEIGGTEGTELLGLIRNDKTNLEVDTVLLLICGDENDRSRLDDAIALGVSGFISKPQSFNSLRENISTVLQIKKYCCAQHFCLSNPENTDTTLKYENSSRFKPTPKSVDEKPWCIDELKTGMVLACAIYTRYGALVLREKEEMTEHHLRRLRKFEGSLASSQVMVYQPANMKS